MQFIRLFVGVLWKVEELRFVGVVIQVEPCSVLAYKSSVHWTTFLQIKSHD